MEFFQPDILDQIPSPFKEALVIQHNSDGFRLLIEGHVSHFRELIADLDPQQDNFAAQYSKAQTFYQAWKSLLNLDELLKLKLQEIE
jgi:hypothetical protein